MKTMPALFVGHGSPMIAIDDNNITREMSEIGNQIIRDYGLPKAILVISAHWYKNRTLIQKTENPEQIFDMYGFPEALYEVKYKPKGFTELSDAILAMKDLGAEVDNTWGIDHGTWSPFAHMFPEARIPVVQLSVNGALTPEQSYQLGKQLAPLRKQGYLIVGSGNKPNSPKWQKAFWGILLALISMVMLYVGGLKSLQTMTLIAALPFGIIMVLLCYCLLKALRADESYYSSKLPYGSLNWDGEHWHDRLKQILTFSQKKDMRRFIAERVRPAFEELKAELAKNDIDAHILEGKNGPFSLELQIPQDQIWNFRYGVTTEMQTISDYLTDEDNAPGSANNKQYIPVTYYTDGRTGNNIQYLTKKEIIADILREYERYISLISDEGNAMLFIDKKKYRQ